MIHFHRELKESSSDNHHGLLSPNCFGLFFGSMVCGLEGDIKPPGALIPWFAPSFIGWAIFKADIHLKPCCSISWI